MKRICERLTAGLFCLFLVGFSLFFWILPDRSFSPTENRDLEPFPTFSAEEFLSGSFAEHMNVYVSDQFPMRELFVKLKSQTELLFGKGENNGVLYTPKQLAVRSFDAYASRNGIYADCDYFYEPIVRAQLEQVNALAERLDIPLVTLIPPRTIDVAQAAFSYQRPYGDELFSLCETVLRDKTGYLPLLEPLREAYDRGEYVMYRTDHHWTTDGAYYAYQALAAALGFTPVTRETLSKIELPGFSGTTASRASFPCYERDTVTVYEDGRSYSVTADGEVLDGLYAWDRANGSDLYSVFLGGTHGVTEIRSDQPRKTLLIAKDSFADCLIPFLAAQFDIVALDLKTHPDLSSAVQEYHADALLIVWNAENLITNASLGNIR